MIRFGGLADGLMYEKLRRMDLVDDERWPGTANYYQCACKVVQYLSRRKTETATTLLLSVLVAFFVVNT
jgi:hypothetical protein